MERYQSPAASNWAGRQSGKSLYLHEKVKLLNLEEEFPEMAEGAIGILGYACDTGVTRNQGRAGATAGPDAIRQILGKLPNHLKSETDLLDLGNVVCPDGELEASQDFTAGIVTKMLHRHCFPVLLGGGHDMAYAHYMGLRKFLPASVRLGIINFDAHFDLRSNERGNNSGSPFYQIATECRDGGLPFHYLCLGIRKDANDPSLFATAREFGVRYLERTSMHLGHLDNLRAEIEDFLEKTDRVFLTIDLDGFSSAYAPGVSAPSPMGFGPEVAIAALTTIIDSRKLISAEIAEMNPLYDIDQQTARLAAGLIHYLLHRPPLG